jgi:hypothetical protein
VVFQENASPVIRPVPRSRAEPSGVGLGRLAPWWPLTNDSVAEAIRRHRNRDRKCDLRSWGSEEVDLALCLRNPEK